MAVLPGLADTGRLTGEQAALRRVATLVARGAQRTSPETVLTARALTATLSRGLARPRGTWRRGMAA